MRYLTLTLCLALWPVLAQQPLVVLGPIEELGLVEDFTTDRQPLWVGKGGANVKFSTQAGYELPGVAGTLLRIELGKHDPSVKEPGANWFRVDRADLPDGLVSPEADGLRLMLGSHFETRWWIQLVLTVEGGQSFSKVICDGALPAGPMIEHNVPFSDLTANGQAMTAAQATKLRGISLISSTPTAVLYVDRITTYRQERFTGWLDLTADHAENQIYQRGERVNLTFTIGGTPPAEAKGFRYEIGDYHGEVTGGAKVALTAAKAYSVDATPTTHGYYEVKAFWTGVDGRDLSDKSCLRAEGTMPTGLSTFAVLPCTIDENIAMFRRLRDQAYFGIHGDFLGIGDLIGLSWRFGYSGWKWLEPKQPDRSNGPAEWAAKAIANGAQPEYQVHILPMRPNLSGEIPAWAKREGPEAPAFANWDDYLAFLRDAVKVEKARYPHQNPRLYGGAWEINLNMQPYVSQQPEWQADEVADLFRRTREVVKAEDPEGQLLGPCPSVLNLEWYERVFQAGVLPYLDGIETHGYMEGAWQPEENDYPGRIARLKALMRQYNHGRELPIYITEIGQNGLLGARKTYREQAAHMVRMAILCKGEGVRVFLPFYGIDYSPTSLYGFLFNKDVAPNPWGTRRCAPKPLVNGFAACVQALEGTSPEAKLEGLGDDVYGYTFRGEGGTVTAVWTTGEARVVKVPAQGRVRVMNFLGHVVEAKAVNGAVEVMVGGGPSYVMQAER